MPAIAVIAGSVRSKSETVRISRIIAEKLRSRADVDLLALNEIDMPLWSEEKHAAEKPAGSFWAEAWPKISGRLAAADGFVMMTPEHHGMATPHLKNLIFCCEAKELAFKPAYLVTVSGSIGGAHPVGELRMSSYKNSYLHWLPDHMIIRSAGGFRPGEEGHNAPPWLEERLDHGLEILTAYAEAAKPLRQNVVRLDLLKNGM